MADFVSFNEFLHRTETARLEHHLDVIKKGLGRLFPRTRRTLTTTALYDQAAAEFANIRRFVHEYYQHSRCVHSFLDSSGNHVDCIPIGQHPALLAARKAGIQVNLKHDPPPARPKVTNLNEGQPGLGRERPVSQLGAHKSDLYGHEWVCPEGCVPVRRITIPRIARMGTLHNFFRKGPPPTAASPAAPVTVGPGGTMKTLPMPPAPGSAALPAATGPDGFTHAYAIAATEEGSYAGCATSLNKWRPRSVPGDMSLSQLWIRRSVTFSRFPQTVESGWTVQPSRTGHLDPTLFVFVNPDGYGPHSGYGLGFIPSEGTPLVLDMPLPDVSVENGTQFNLVLQWNLDSSGDWVLFTLDPSNPEQMVKVGHIPGGLYAAGGDNPWNRIDFGGEVASLQNDPRTGQMGSGKFPADPVNDGFRSVAFQAAISIRRAGTNSMKVVPLNEIDTGDHASYRLAVGPSNVAGATIYFGGPGDAG
jgi:hypothetical protein